MPEKLSFGIRYMGDDVISRQHDVMISKQLTSWIRHLGLKENVSETSKTAKNY